MWTDEIWLVLDRRGAQRMTKNKPMIKRGEIPVKLVLEIEEDAFREPTLVRHVRIADWREGVDMGDLKIANGVITEEEAKMIVAQRRQHMIDQLRELGYQIVEPAEPEEPELKVLGE